jgi:hypothetical protein
MEMDFATIIIGWIISMVTLVGGIIARDRYISASISTGDKAVRDEMDKKVGVLHERVNNTRDEFVRRDDLDGHLGRIEKTINSMHEEQKETNKRIDGFMAEMVKKK